MAGSEYYSMLHLNEVVEKLNKLEIEKNNLIAEKEYSAQVAAELEKEIIAERPELEKKIAKIKKHPNTASGKANQLDPEYSDFYCKCKKFLDKFCFSEYEADRDLKKIQEKIDDLYLQKNDIESKLSAHFKLRDNLPEQFTEALENVHKRIFEWFETARENKIKLFTQYQEAPMYYALQNKGTPSKYFGDNCRNKGWNFSLIKVSSDEEIIASLKEVGITDYFGRPIEDCVKSHSDLFVYYCKKIIANEQKRNLQAEADDYFNVEKCRFIDEIVRNCAEVKSVENVRIGEDGSINGIIHATNGDFNLRSVGAGGYNIQCFHYRVIITKLNK